MNTIKFLPHNKILLNKTLLTKTNYTKDLTSWYTIKNNEGSCTNTINTDSDINQEDPNGDNFSYSKSSNNFNHYNAGGPLIHNILKLNNINSQMIQTYHHSF